MSLSADVPTKLGLSLADDPQIKLGQANPGPLGINGIFGTHDVTGDYTDADHLGSTRYANIAFPPS